MDVGQARCDVFTVGRQKWLQLINVQINFLQNLTTLDAIYVLFNDNVIIEFLFYLIKALKAGLQ